MFENYSTISSVMHPDGMSKGWGREKRPTLGIPWFEGQSGPHSVVSAFQISRTNLAREPVTNFHGHWSIQIVPAKKVSSDWSMRISLTFMDQCLSNLSESSCLHRHRSIECSSLPWTILEDANKNSNLQDPFLTSLECGAVRCWCQLTSRVQKL